MGWLMWLARLTAGAAALNLFTIYLGYFWPAADQRSMRILIATLLVAGIAAVNVFEVKSGTRMGSFAVHCSFCVIETQMHLRTAFPPVNFLPYWGLLLWSCLFPACIAANSKSCSRLPPSRL